MAGIVGYAPLNGQPPQKKVVEAMSQITSHRKSFLIDKIFIDSNIGVSKCHANTIPTRPQPYQSNNVIVWFDGEWYNVPQLKNKFLLTGAFEEECVHQAYIENKLTALLKEVDGTFNAVIYDEKKKKVYFDY